MTKFLTVEYKELNNIAKHLSPINKSTECEKELFTYIFRNTDRKAQNVHLL